MFTRNTFCISVTNSDKFWFEVFSRSHWLIEGTSTLRSAALSRRTKWNLSAASLLPNVITEHLWVQWHARGRSQIADGKDNGQMAAGRLSWRLIFCWYQPRCPRSAYEQSLQHFARPSAARPRLPPLSSPSCCHFRSIALCVWLFQEKPQRHVPMTTRTEHRTHGASGKIDLGLCVRERKNKYFDVGGRK